MIITRRSPRVVKCYLYSESQKLKDRDRGKTVSSKVNCLIFHSEFPQFIELNPLNDLSVPIIDLLDSRPETKQISDSKKLCGLYDTTER